MRAHVLGWRTQTERLTPLHRPQDPSDFRRDVDAYSETSEPLWDSVVSVLHLSLLCITRGSESCVYVEWSERKVQKGLLLLFLPNVLGNLSYARTFVCPDVKSVRPLPGRYGTRNSGHGTGRNRLIQGTERQGERVIPCPLSTL